MIALLNAIISNEFFILFLVVALGLLVGKIKIKNISLETSGALFVGLIFGAYGFKASNVLFNFALILFVSAVGLLAAKDVGKVVKLYGPKFAVLGTIVTFGGALATYIVTIIYQKGLDPFLVSGTYTGALTSSPGFAAALEATNNNPMVSIGHAVAYPVGVVIVILFVQLVPHIFKIDIDRELELYKTEMKTATDFSNFEDVQEEFNIISYSLVIIAGAV
ncbi:MAG TPA: YidE/YbjL duplication, partial [Thermoanaerobacterales bacterium]|nr:YidE/YbjL duplication [Thermoanaerobacterales bacterium]